MACVYRAEGNISAKKEWALMLVALFYIDIHDLKRYRLCACKSSRMTSHGDRGAVEFMVIKHWRISRSRKFSLSSRHSYI